MCVLQTQQQLLVRPERVRVKPGGSYWSPTRGVGSWPVVSAVGVSRVSATATGDSVGLFYPPATVKGVWAKNQPLGVLRCEANDRLKADGWTRTVGCQLLGKYECLCLPKLDVRWVYLGICWQTASWT